MPSETTVNRKKQVTKHKKTAKKVPSGESPKCPTCSGKDTLVLGPRSDDLGNKGVSSFCRTCMQPWWAKKP